MKKLDTLVKDIYSLFNEQIDSNIDEKELDKQLLSYVLRDEKELLTLQLVFFHLQ